jgi:hypothetical protein
MKTAPAVLKTRGVKPNCDVDLQMTPRFGIAANVSLNYVANNAWMAGSG